MRGPAPYEEWREAALAAGASPLGERAPDVEAALRRFGRMAEPEVEAVCGLAGPRARAELWRLASEWRPSPRGCSRAGCGSRPRERIPRGAPRSPPGTAYTVQEVVSRLTTLRTQP